MKTRTIGYHGCDLSVAGDVVMRAKKPEAGEARYDWLGTGIYFWEDDPALALGWAKHVAKRHPDRIKQPAVFGAVLDLSDCLDLTQTAATRILPEAFRALCEEVSRAEGTMPVNVDDEHRYLDHAVFETLHKLRAARALTPFASVRALFQSGEPVFPGSGIRKFDHIQICVRDTAKIEGCFLP